MNSINLLVGNVCSLLAMVTDSVSAAQKTVKRVLLIQCISQLIYCAGTIVLKGYSGATQNVVSIFRNFFAMGNQSNKYIEWSLVALGVILGICFNNIGFMGLLPVIANLQYAIVMFRLRGNEKILKISFMLNAVMFAAFNGALLNVVGVVTNSIVAVTTAASLIRDARAA